MAAPSPAGSEGVAQENWLNAPNIITLSRLVLSLILFAGISYGGPAWGIPAAILVLRKNKKDKNVLFIDASREFVSGKNQNQLSEEHIAKIVATYKARQSVDKYAHLATPEEMASNDYNLNIPRYVDTFEEEAEIDLMAVRAEREKLKAELVDLEVEMDGYLKELGYLK